MDQVTPLPKLHLISILLLRLGHPLQQKSPYSWLPEALKKSPAVSDENLGTYVGLVEGLFTFAIAASLLVLVSYADRIGRKPVVLISMMGAALSICAFGFAGHLATLIVFRALGGLFSGSQAVLRTIMAETVDDTNMGVGFALFSSCWQMGSLLAPVVGGLLSHPTRFALFASSSLFSTYPYLLPCLISGLVPGLGVLLAIFFMKETMSDLSIDHAKYVPLSQDEEARTPPPSPRPDGMRSLVKSDGISQILIAWAWFMFNQATFETCSIVYASTAIELGGLSLSTQEIGLALLVLAIGTTLNTIFIFPGLVQRLGAVRLAQLASWGTPLACLSMPLWHWAVSATPPDSARWVLWLSMVITMTVRIPAIMATQALEMYASRRAPQKSMTAKLNGLISLLGNSCFAVGPLFSASIFSFGLSYSASALPAFGLFSVLGFAGTYSIYRVRPPLATVAEVAEKPVP